MSALVGASVAALLVWGAYSLRTRTRVVHLVEPPPDQTPGSNIFDLIGRFVWVTVLAVPSLRQRRLSNSDLRRLGRGVVLTVVTAAVISIPFAVVIALGSWASGPLASRRSRSERLRAIDRELPMVVDLFRIAVTSGMNISMATAAVASRLEGPLAGELRRVTQEVERGRRVADALEDVVIRTSEATRPLFVAMASSERYGASLSVLLERVAHELRLDQERRAERVAKKLSLQLLFPVAGCTLPAFALLTVAPLLAGSFGTLALTSF